jgi:hypothetical protein
VHFLPRGMQPSFAVKLERHFSVIHTIVRLSSSSLSYCFRDYYRAIEAEGGALKPSSSSG